MQVVVVGLLLVLLFAPISVFAQAFEKTDWKVKISEFSAIQKPDAPHILEFSYDFHYDGNQPRASYDVWIDLTDPSGDKTEVGKRTFGDILQNEKIINTFTVPIKSEGKYTAVLQIKTPEAEINQEIFVSQIQTIDIVDINKEFFPNRDDLDDRIVFTPLNKDLTKSDEIKVEILDNEFEKIVLTRYGEEITQYPATLDAFYVRTNESFDGFAVELHKLDGSGINPIVEFILPFADAATIDELKFSILSPNERCDDPGKICLTYVPPVSPTVEDEDGTETVDILGFNINETHHGYLLVAGIVLAVVISAVIVFFIFNKRHSNPKSQFSGYMKDLEG